MQRTDTTNTRTPHAKLGLFDLRTEWQARSVATLDTEHVSALAATLSDGGALPPLSVVELESGALALVDGYHRYAAYLEAQVREAPYTVVGRGEAAIAWHLARANATNGRERTRADKRAAVRRALEAPEGADMSNVDIARWCCVSDELVRSVRAEVRGAASAAEERQQVIRGERAAEGSAEVSRETSRDARRRNAGNGDPPGGRNAGNGDPDPCPEPLPFEPADAPMSPVEKGEPWREVAAAQKAIADEVTAIKRRFSVSLKHLRDVVTSLDAVRTACTTRAWRECPAPGPHAECPVCEGRGFVTMAMSESAVARILEGRRVS